VFSPPTKICKMDPLNWAEDFESHGGSAFHLLGGRSSSRSTSHRDLYSPPQRGLYPLSIRYMGEATSFGLMEGILRNDGMVGRSTGGNGRSGVVETRYIPDAVEDSMTECDSFQWTNCLHVTVEGPKECTLFLSKTHLSVLYQSSKSPALQKRKSLGSGDQNKKAASRALAPIAPDCLRSPSEPLKQFKLRSNPPRSVEKAQRDAVRRLQCLDSSTKAEALKRLREAGGVLNTSFSLSSFSLPEDDGSQSSESNGSSLMLKEVKALENELLSTKEEMPLTPKACELSSPFSEQEMEYIRKIKLRAQQYLKELPADEASIEEEDGHDDNDSYVSDTHPDDKSVSDEAVELTWSLAGLTEAYPRRYRLNMIAMEIFGPSCGPKPSQKFNSANQRLRSSPLMIQAERDESGIIISPLSETSVYIVFCPENPETSMSEEDGALPSGDNGRKIDVERRRKDFLWKLKLNAPQLNLDFWYFPFEETFTRVRSGTSKDPLRCLMDAWCRGCISNYDYLLRLNCIAGRSQHDITSYPVLPWVLSNYTSRFVDLSDKRNFRDLSKPMGALDDDRLQNVFMKKYRALEAMASPVKLRKTSEEDLADDDRTIPPFMYGSHYSSVGGVVLHYLVRMKPFDRLHKQLQGGSFDFADRLFDSVPRTWEKCSKISPTEVKELTKEWYSNPSFLCNHNDFMLGTSAKGKIVSDIELPPWAHESPALFVQIMRSALDGEVCSQTLHQWIDLIFGFKQRGEEAEKAYNVFYHLTYYNATDISLIRDGNRRLEVEHLISDLGHCPTQLFNEPHLPKQVGLEKTRARTHISKSRNSSVREKHKIVKRPQFRINTEAATNDTSSLQADTYPKLLTLRSSHLNSSEDKLASF